MELDLILFEGSIENNPEIHNLERKSYEIARSQIDAEVTPGTFEGPRYLGMIRYRQLKLLKHLDVASFVAKALVIAEIEKIRLWTAFGYKTPEEAAELEAEISPSEYSNIKDLWNIIIPFFKRSGISVEELLMKKGSNLRVCIPILKSIATNRSSGSEKVNRRIQQMKGETREIAESTQKVLTEEDVRKQIVENIMELMNGRNKDLRIALDPYAPENAREGDPKHPQYPCLFIPDNGRMLVVIELDNDGIEEFMPFLQNRCVIDYVQSGDDPKTYPLMRKLYSLIESSGQKSNDGNVVPPQA